MTPSPCLAVDAPKARLDVNYSRSRLPGPAPVLVRQEPGTPEMNITGSHMLLALALAFCLAGPLAWAFVRYWLFAL
jgi:hypothetical protein